MNAHISEMNAERHQKMSRCCVRTIQHMMSDLAPEVG